MHYRPANAGLFFRLDSISCIWTVSDVIRTVFHQFGQYSNGSRQYRHLMVIKTLKDDALT